MNSEKINKLSKEIHAANVSAGWWPEGRSLITAVHLITTEICEATEGMRKDLMDDHLPHRKMEEVELADALIRTLDLGGKLGLQYEEYLTQSHDFKIKQGNADPEKHFDIVYAACGFGMSIRRMKLIGLSAESLSVPLYYSMLVKKIINESVRRGFDIESAMFEKLEYNKQRADHKPENRAKEHGKKF